MVTGSRQPDNLAPGAKVKCPSCGLQFNLPETENVSGRESRVLPYEDQGGDQLGPHLLKEVPTDYVIDLDTWLRHARAHWSAVLGSMILYMVIVALIISLISGAVRIVPWVGIPLLVLVIPPLEAGFMSVALAQLQGRSWTFSTFFEGFQKFGALLIYWLLFSLCSLAASLPLLVVIVCGGLLAALPSPKPAEAAQEGVAEAVPPKPLEVVQEGVPEEAPKVAAATGPKKPNRAFVLVFFFVPAALLLAFYFSLRTGAFGVMLILDRDYGGVQALQASWRMTHGHFWGLFGVWVSLKMLQLCSPVLCCLGILFVLPLTYLTQAAGYLLIAGTQPPVERLASAE